MPKDFDPEDPMELVGVSIPGGNIDEVADSFIQEFLLMGWTELQILILFKSPYYGATHQILLQKGEDYVKQRIRHAASEWRKGWITGGELSA